MNQHYYSQNPIAKQNEKQWEYTLGGKSFHFVSDNGVFSKNTLDFGSRLLIENFDSPLVAGPILDVGCGYGPIGMAIAYNNTERQIELIDINERAIYLAKKNIEQNGLANAEAHQSDLYTKLNYNEYAAIVSNPPIRAGKQVVHTILEGAFPLLSGSGSLTIVIQKKQGAPSAMKKMEAIFGNVAVIARSKGYFILQSIRS